MAFLTVRYRAFITVLATVPLFCAFPYLAAPASAQVPELLYEQKIEAGLIYNFLKYTSWPNHTPGRGNLRVCLLDGDPFKGYLDPLQGRTAQQSRVDIIHIASYTEIDGCQILFVPEHLSPSLDKILDFAKTKPVLTVSNIEGFTRHGGMVEFAMRKDQRIHMYINAARATAENLAIAPRLQRLAEKAP